MHSGLLAAQHPLDMTEKLIYVSRCAFSIFLELNRRQGMDKLANWPKILLEFRMVMKKVDVRVNPPQDPSRSAASRLLGMISRNETSKIYAKIEGNFLIAALHIACMKEPQLSQDSYPDLPENLGIMVDR